MRVLVSIVVVFLLLLSLGCQSKTGRYGAAGAATGGILGAIIGHQSDHATEGAAIGAAVGGAAGAAAGHHQEKQDEN